MNIDTNNDQSMYSTGTARILRAKKNRQSAKRAHRDELKTIETRITELQSWVAEQKRAGFSADFGDVATAAHYRSQLDETTDSMLKRNEYAPENRG